MTLRRFKQNFCQVCRLRACERNIGPNSRVLRKKFLFCLELNFTRQQSVKHSGPGSIHKGWAPTHGQAVKEEGGEVIPHSTWELQDKSGNFTPMAHFESLPIKWELRQDSSIHSNDHYSALPKFEISALTLNWSEIHFIFGKHVYHRHHSLPWLSTSRSTAAARVYLGTTTQASDYSAPVDTSCGYSSLLRDYHTSFRLFSTYRWREERNTCTESNQQCTKRGKCR